MRRNDTADSGIEMIAPIVVRNHSGGWAVSVPAIAVAPENTQMFTCQDRGLSPLVAGNIAVLSQLSEVVQALTDEQYTRRRVGGVVSSVGAHVRHCLDHVQAVLRAAENGVLDYDTRDRGTEIERSREAALDEIDRQIASLRQFRPWTGRERLILRAMATADSVVDNLPTSLGRELGFVLSHTIHHCSLIAIMIHSLGITAPNSFGYAPSTLAHLESPACVQSR